MTQCRAGAIPVLSHSTANLATIDDRGKTSDITGPGQKDPVTRPAEEKTLTTRPISSHVHQLAATKLASVGQRYTANRKAVVDVLCTLPGPATIAELLASGGELAQSSTYRNLVVLEEVGVVHRIVTSDDHARFELTEEITGHHHHHLICEQCGRIIDVTLEAEIEAALQKALGDAAMANGFTGLHHRVDLMGECSTCTNGAASDPGSGSHNRS